MVIVGSASRAYRADVESHGGEFGASDACWLVVATVLEHAALVPVAHRGPLLRDAVELATAEIGADAVARRRVGEWSDADAAPSDAILCLSDDAQQAGAFRIAAQLLDTLLAADRSLSRVQRGRSLSKRARISWKLGDLDAAERRYRRVARMGRESDSLELKARASIGLAAIAQMRRDSSGVIRHSRRAAVLAEDAGLTKLARQAFNGLAIAAGGSGNIELAITYGWKVFLASAGDPTDEAEALQNIAQALLDAGYSAEARSAFASVITRRVPSRIMLPGLGGFALACAAGGDEIATRWAAREVERLAATEGHKYAVAAALEECASATAQVGQTALSRHLHDSAVAIADEHGFTELASLARRLAQQRAADSPPLQRDAALVAHHLRKLQPRRLPRHVVVAAASA